MFNQAPSDSFKANILRTCELDTISATHKRTKEDVANCKYLDLKTLFVFKDSSISISYSDSAKTVETLKVNGKGGDFGVYIYKCLAEGKNILLFYYKNIGLVKIYFYNPDDKKTYVNFYLNSSH